MPGRAYDRGLSAPTPIPRPIVKNRRHRQHSGSARQSLPGIPANLGIDYKVTDAWTVGGTGIAASGQYLFGDEANLNLKTQPYFVLNLHTSYQITKNLQFFGLIENAFNTKYSTFGTFSPTSSVFIAQAPGATNPRSYSPAAPIAGTVGLRVTF